MKASIEILLNIKSESDSLQSSVLRLSEASQIKIEETPVPLKMSEAGLSQASSPPSAPEDCGTESLEKTLQKYEADI